MQLRIYYLLMGWVWRLGWSLGKFGGQNDVAGV
jgi:hypothetical protein